MALNPFEQLQQVVTEPRQSFEDVVAIILRCTIPGSRRVRVYRGDGGVDVFNGTYGAEGKVDVYQIKYFSAQWEESQKRQIKDSYNTARNSPDYRLDKWILCVPTRLTKNDIRWFDEWREGKEIELIDGDDLTELLNQEECKQARQRLREWGVGGLQQAGARFTGSAVISRSEPQKTGFTFYVQVQIANEGDRTAKGIRVSIEHSETSCVAGGKNADEWAQAANDGTLIPRRLNCRIELHPQQKSAIMLINICERTEFPLGIKLTIWSEDASPVQLSCTITKEDAEKTTTPQFIPLVLGQQSSAVAQTTNPHSIKIAQPTHPAAKEILDAILKHPNSDQRGLKEILEGEPGNNLNAAFLATTASHGSAGVFTMRKRLFREGVDELVQLGWLLPPEMDGSVNIYELNPEAYN